MSVVRGCVRSPDPYSSIPLEILLEKEANREARTGPLQRPSLRVLSVTQGSSPHRAPQHPSSLRQAVTNGIRGGLYLA